MAPPSDFPRDDDDDSTDDGVVSDDRNASYISDGVETLLLRGGITVRSGPWRLPVLDGGGDVSGVPPRRWGSAAAGAKGTFGKTFGRDWEGEEGLGLWAVEVGWFVVADGHGEEEQEQEEEGQEEEQKKTGTTGEFENNKMKREVLTTVLDARTMAPLGAWKGSERRPPR